jgi:hypothetical protein
LSGTSGWSTNVILTRGSKSETASIGSKADDKLVWRGAFLHPVSGCKVLQIKILRQLSSTCAFVRGVFGCKVPHINHYNFYVNHLVHDCVFLHVAFGCKVLQIKSLRQSSFTCALL